MIYSCCDRRRLAILENQGAYNGIRFLDVVDDPNQLPSDRQRTLRVHFVHPLLPNQLTAANVKITGGERIQDIHVLQAFDETLGSPGGDPDVLVVVVNQAGDFSMYTLSLVDTANPAQPPSGFDQVLSSIDFSFKAACVSDLDCKSTNVCPPPAREKADIAYLAKDYASFRALMLDRLAKIIPQWQERNPADLGIVLVELLAYIGDYLSYLQDAVATEGYLRTARRRTSVRRLVRLVDYPMLDGRNARTWVHLDVRADVHQLKLPKESLQFLTKTNDPSVILLKDSIPYQMALNTKPRVFEAMEDVTVSAELNSIRFYTWGNRACCLPQGTVQAFLWGSYPQLVPGMVLILQEVTGPETGASADADPTHRVAVRLTGVDSLLSDPLGGQFLDPPNNSPIPVTRITWAAGDALPFPLCISSTSPDGFFDDVSLAFGNNVLADEGRTISDETLAPAPAPNPVLTPAAAPDRCNPVLETLKPARYRPTLKQGPLTFADRNAYDSTAPAQSALNSRKLDSLLPAIQLKNAAENETWNPQRDLLRSPSNRPDFVAETENDGTAFLRFGDDIFGKRPVPGTEFSATYRVLQGLAGNVGCDSLQHVASADPSLVTNLSNPTVILNVRNPLPATGGLDPESIESVRQAAPYAFRTQERAVTPDDYGQMAQRCDSSLQRALGTFRWTGSWQTVFISVDPKGGAQIQDSARKDLLQCMEYYRMAGHDVEVDSAIYVPLEIEMNVCLKPEYFPADVERALLDALSNRILSDGSRGLFHPDNLTFGQTVYLSPVYAKVQATPGVDSVTIIKFQRQGQDSDEGITNGKLPLHRLEIARLDNDPNFPGNGTLKLTFTGGQ